MHQSQGKLCRYYERTNTRSLVVTTARSVTGISSWRRCEGALRMRRLSVCILSTAIRPTHSRWKNGLAGSARCATLVLSSSFMTPATPDRLMPFSTSTAHLHHRFSCTHLAILLFTDGEGNGPGVSVFKGQMLVQDSYKQRVLKHRSCPVCHQGYACPI